MPIEFGSLSLGATAGTVVGVLIGHYLTKSRNTEDRKIKEFNQAADTFRDAFIPELSAIRNPSFDETTKPIDPHDLLKEAFGKHRTAYEVFRLFLNGSCQNEFDRTWINYYAYDNEGNGGYEHLVKYSPGWEQNPPGECRATAIINIEKLLEFAEHK